MTEVAIEIGRAVSQALGKQVELPDLSFDPVGEGFKVEVDPDGQFIRVAYVSMDPWPPQDFWGESGERGGYRRFRLTSTRERYLRRLEDEHGYAFDVEATSDGLKARLLGTAGASAGVYALPDSMAEKVRGGEIDLDRAMQAADSVLEDYWAWARGEACGIVVDRFRVGEDGISPFEHDAEWTVSSERNALLRLEQERVPQPEPSSGFGL